MSDSSEGFIDVRFVFGRDGDEDSCPVIYRVERMGYLLPAGATAEHLEEMTNDFREYPYELIGTIAEIFAEVPAPTESSTAL